LQVESRSRARAVGLLALSVVFGAGSCKRLASLGRHTASPGFGRPRVDEAAQKMLDHIAEDPKFQAELLRGPGAGPKDEKMNLAVSSSGYRELGAQLAAKGAARLSVNEFLELSKMKLKLAEASPKLCAGFWSGGLNTMDFGAGLDSLSDRELARWFTLSERAVHLQLYATTPLPRFAGTALTEGLRDIADALPPADGQTLRQTMQQGVAAAPEAGCKAYLALERGGLGFPEARRDAFLRALTFDSLVDW
jgi:hypothetical protein